MKLKEIVELFNCMIYTPSIYNENKDIDYAFCADLVSDTLMVLRTINDEKRLSKTIIITGLVTNQSVRAAEILDVPVILFVRGKKPQEQVVNCAIEAGITILMTEWTMFNTSGEMYIRKVKGLTSNLDR